MPWKSKKKWLAERKMRQMKKKPADISRNRLRSCIFIFIVTTNGKVASQKFAIIVTIFNITFRLEFIQFLCIPKNLNEANEWTNEWNEQERKYWKNAVCFAYHNAVIIYKWSSEHGAYHFKWYQVTNAYANLELYRVSHSSHRIVRSTAICSGSRYI